VDAPLLDIRDLRVEYQTFEGRVQAVNGLDLAVQFGQNVGLVGETGAGKTTTALSILRLVPRPPGRIIHGEILFEGTDLLKQDEAYLRKVRGNKISMIFQNPMTSLNPVLTVGQQIAGAIRQHQDVSRSEAMRMAGDMLELVGLQASRVRDYRHQFSGGMRQRVGIAMALVCNPALLIADEPTTALDVTIQAQVLEVMNGLRTKYNTSLLMITHNLGIVTETCDHVAVMYAGQIVETGSIESVFRRPAHPYTIGLFDSLPDIEATQDRLQPIPGTMPNPLALPPGCKFEPRCPKAMPTCREGEPRAVSISPSQRVACFLYGKEGVA